MRLIPHLRPQGIPSGRILAICCRVCCHACLCRRFTLTSGRVGSVLVLCSTSSSVRYHHLREEGKRDRLATLLSIPLGHDQNIIPRQKKAHPHCQRVSAARRPAQPAGSRVPYLAGCCRTSVRLAVAPAAGPVGHAGPAAPVAGARAALA